MKKILLILLSAVLSSGVAASEREAKIRILMEAQGLLEIFENQIELGKIQGEKAGQQMMDQMLSQLNPDEEFKSRFKSAFSNFIGKLQAPWGAGEIVNVWARYYGKHFNETELDQLIAFYTSPLGEKEVAASKSALPEFTTHFQKLGQPIFTQATQDYIKELKIIAKECKCKR